LNDNPGRTGSLPVANQFDHANVEDNIGQFVHNMFIGKETGFPWYKKRRVKLMLIGQVKGKSDVEAKTGERMLLLFKYEKWKLFP
jgi:hypothetical protein